jgi:deoxyribonuclease V
MIMNHRKSAIIHPWRVSFNEAKEIQNRLSRQVTLKSDLGRIETVLGVGVVYSADQREVFAGCVSLSFPELEIQQEVSSKRRLVFPYVPGFFAFSAGPAILAALEKMERPDLIMFPGRGIAHPRGLGLASHLGVVLDLPTIALSKTPLWRDQPEPASGKGAYTLVKAGDKKLVGAAVRTKEGTKPVFISPGHRISIRTAIKIVVDCCPRYRIPEPLRSAHALAKNEASGIWVSGTKTPEAGGMA